MKFPRGIRPKDCSGLTLLEIILSLALLGILAVSFLPIFTGGVLMINVMGNMSRASAEAQDIIDRVYGDTKFDDDLDWDDLRSAVVDALDDLSIVSFEDFSDKPELINSLNSNTRVRYIVSETPQVFLISGKAIHVLTVRVYYHNYARSVELSSPLVR